MLIVGTGGAGLTAALRAHSLGLNPLIIEKSQKIGGTSAYSGGGIWIPDNPINKAAGTKDSLEDALLYMDTLIGDVGRASSRERRVAFLENGPRMVSFLQSIGFQWRSCPGYPDYYPHLPGGTAEGRCLAPEIFNLRRLGAWRQHLRVHPFNSPLPIYVNEAAKVARFATSSSCFWVLFKLLALRLLPRMLLGQIPRTMGPSLIGQLLFLNIQRKVRIYRNASLVKLVVHNGSVVGALINQDGRQMNIHADKGVLLAAGGFAKNKEMR